MFGWIVVAIAYLLMIFRFQVQFFPVCCGTLQLYGRFLYYIIKGVRDIWVDYGAE